MIFFKKKKTFPFLFSFFATLVIGIFIWGLLPGYGNVFLLQILGEKNVSKLFLASVVSDVEEPEAEINTEIRQELEPEPESEIEPEVAEPEIADTQIEIVNQQDIQDTLDDIQEKIDIIRQQILILQKQQNPEKEDEEIKEEKEEKKEDENDKYNNEEKSEIKKEAKNKTSTGGTAPQISYPTILISEVQIAGLTDKKEEFVELYNPNNFDVNLSGWYLQKKTSSGRVDYFEKKSLFSEYNISILKNSYFLIARSGYFLNLNPISISDALSENSSLILNNPNDIISDEVSWLEITDGLSFGRKWDEVSQNYLGFELQNPTPKAPNFKPNFFAGLLTATVKSD